MDVYDPQNAEFPPALLPDVLTEDDMGHPDPGDAIAWPKEVLRYNVIGGKCQRGFTGQITFQELVESRKQDADRLSWL